MAKPFTPTYEVGGPVPKLSIIIPAYNEEKNIYQTIDRIVKVHDRLGYDYEVLVVVDGSPDKTATVAKSHRSKNLRVLSYQPNRGKGYALKYGTSHALGEIITFTDAGGDFDPKQFDKFVKLLEIFDADFVLGSKRHPASKVNYPRRRRIFSKIYQLMIKILFGLNVTDTQAGLKFLKRDVARDVVSRALVKQYAFDLEMLVIAHQLGYKRIFEAPIELDFNAVSSGINFKTIKKMIIDTLAIFYRARILNYYRKQKMIKEKTQKIQKIGKKLVGRNYLIAGGAGFLGANLTKKILEEGGQVVVVDNLQTGNIRNLGELKKFKNFRFKKWDICQPLKIRDHFDYVLNLACPASPPKYYLDPIKTLETNSIGTENLLKFANKNNARFFHTSTSEVYGDPKEHPQKESYSGNVEPYAMRSCYDEGKRYAEALIYQAQHQKNVNTGVVRVFNTYGPMMDPDDGRVVSNFVKQALSGEDITIQGSGRQTRSFCFVDDLVEVMMKFIHSDLEGPINIGNPKEFTILELAKKVIELTGSKSKIIHIEPAISDPKIRRPDITLVKKLLGWQPKIELEEGLKRTIDWFSEIGF
ncbi:MAG: dTDP-glucose 4,6-dehydratase [Candidatus Berkelbacteria bacterium Athens1014_28]|uniref:UDP-glucuronate decarboxylase n=1 Tax=Candidatus Berkelbacteria bacterium Athens1014_28 TaxID=2017145 RepID=A0A554LL97_9BACT|nr:MAG: dTDP-glucose 4,6-dehydratase [Candidatus Berkelbacteria bacterium Athens1014_28]